MRTDPPQPVKSRKEQAEILALQMVQFVLREETTAVGFLQACRKVKRRGPAA